MNTPFNRRTAVVAGATLVAVVIVAAIVWKHLHEGHAHDRGGAVLALDEGKRWNTDQPLRLGMKRIREAATPVVAGLGTGQLTAAQAKAFADAVTMNFADIAKNCRLPPKADAAFHVLITELLRGAEMLRQNPQSKEGAAAVTKALRDYAEYFEDPSWSPWPEVKA